MICLIGVAVRIRSGFSALDGGCIAVAASALVPALWGSSIAPNPISAVIETPAIILSRLFRRIELLESILSLLSGRLVMRKGARNIGCASQQNRVAFATCNKRQ